MLQRIFTNWLQIAVPLLSCCFGIINNHKGSIALGLSAQIHAVLCVELSAVQSDVIIQSETQQSLGCLSSVQCHSVSDPVFWLLLQLSRTLLLSLYGFVFPGEEFSLPICIPGTRDNLAA